jgi:PAS domain S-box-containing protein
LSWCYNVCKMNDQNLDELKREIATLKQKLAESEDRFSSFFSSMCEGVALHEIICDCAGKPVDYRFLDVNPAFERSTGLKKENILGKTVLEVLPKTEPLWIEKYGSVALTGLPIDFENYTVALDRHYHVVAFSPRKNQFAVIFTDITESKQVQERLENNMRELRLAQTHMITSEKMAGIGRLAAAVTHELRNPLMYITANVGLLSQYFKTIEEGVDHLGKELSGACTKAQQDYATFHKIFLRAHNEIVLSMNDSQEGCSRANEIIAGLLDYARVDGAMSQAVDLNCAIDKALEFVDSDIRYKCRVEKRLHPGAVVLGNQRELEQVFVNLFINASQAIEKDGLIRIENSVKDGYVIIRVQDNGRGVAQEDIGRLFEPFFTTKKDGEGTGLGLAIIHKILERHGGDIAVESKVDVGTTFIIKLPVKKE